MPNVLVNDSDWNGLSQDDQAQITNIISSNFGSDYAITPDPNGLSGSVASFSPDTVGVQLGVDVSAPVKQDCLTVCDRARDAAIVAAAFIPNPIVKALAIAAAWAAWAGCRALCAAL